MLEGREFAELIRDLRDLASCGQRDLRKLFFGSALDDIREAARLAPA